MKTLFYLFCFIFLSGAIFAEQINLNPASSGCVYSEKEMELFEQLSKRHLDLLKKEAQLNEKEKSLNVREALLRGNAPAFATKSNSNVRIYTQLPPAKAVKLLDAETPEKAAEILSQMPTSISSRLIDKMEPSRAETIIKLMGETTKD